MHISETKPSTAHWLIPLAEVAFNHAEAGTGGERAPNSLSMHALGLASLSPTGGISDISLLVSSCNMALRTLWQALPNSILGFGVMLVGNAMTHH